MTSRNNILLIIVIMVLTLSVFTNDVWGSNIGSTLGKVRSFPKR